VDHADSDTPPPQLELERREQLLSCPPSLSQNITTNNTQMVQQQQGARLLVPSEANDGDQSLNKTNTTTIAAANNNRGHAEKDQSINYNGIVVAFGDNTHGQLGCGNDISLSFTPLVLDTLSPLKVTMLSLALTTEGKVYLWGTSEDGSLGRKDDTGSSPSLVTGFHSSNHGPNGTVDGATNEAKIVQITAGYGHSLALSAAGDIYMWGSYTCFSGEFEKHPLKYPPRGSHDLPVFVPGPGQKVKKISTGAVFNAALLEDNTIVTWGIGIDGELAWNVTVMDRTKQDKCTLLGIVEREYLTPHPPEWAVLSKMKHVTTISCGGYHLLVVTREGSEHDVFSSGLNNYGQLGLGDEVNRNSLLHKIEYFAMHSIDISTVEGGGSFHALWTVRGGSCTLAVS